MEANEANTSVSGAGADHAIATLRRDVDSTHPGLGALAAVSVIAAKAQKCLLVIAPSGTGKSAVVEWLERVLPNAFRRGEITMAGVRKFQHELCDSDANVLIEDLGEAGGDYHRASVAILMTALCYGHQMIRDTHQISVNIQNFNGSCFMGVQPGVLESLVKDLAWHSNIRDKSLRYYHLQRPTAPNFTPIRAGIEWGESHDDVLPVEHFPAEWAELESIGRVQWSYARAQEHMLHLLQACALLDGRYAVNQSDYDVLLPLLRQMVIEREALERDGLDAQARLNRNLLLMLVEFASYPLLTYDIVCSDYQMRPRKLQAVLENMQEWYYKVQNSPVVLVPSDALKELLKEAGLR